MTPDIVRTLLASELVRRAGAIVLILVAALVVTRLSASGIRRLLRPGGDRAVDDVRRRTLQPLLENLVQYVVVFIAAVMVLRQLDVDATAIIASAGIAGLAIGFGAQTLIRDLIAGFFLLSEGLIRVGDEITFEGKTGTVERVNIRTTQVRTPEGVLWTIPNGMLQVFGTHVGDRDA